MLMMSGCRFNEMAKSATGETSKAAQTRALLFDTTFIMLIHIIQLYGLEVCMNCHQHTSLHYVM